MNVLSLSKKKLINYFFVNQCCFSLGIFTINEQILFLIGGNEKWIDIYYYNSFLKRINNAHNKIINGFISLKNNSFVSYSNDGHIKIWSYII